MPNYEIESLTNDRGFVSADYKPNIPGFGVFFEVGYRNDFGTIESTLVEVTPKKARKLAKRILKMTKKEKS